MTMQDIVAEHSREAAVLADARAGADVGAVLRQLAHVSLGRLAEPAGTDPQGTARICAAIFQGLVLQQAWNPELDIATCIDAVIALIDAITRPARN
jgi:hypothetical protein